nr:helix-turn-helix domain-containing protein [uncultured Duganella sp.]
MTPKIALDAAISAAGSLQSLAETLGVTKGAVHQWTLEGRKVPARHCPAIERQFSVRCEDLRPDFDWAFVRARISESSVIPAPATVTPHKLAGEVA